MNEYLHQAAYAVDTLSTTVLTMGNDVRSLSNKLDQNKSQTVSERVVYAIHLKHTMKDFNEIRRQMMKEFKDEQKQTTTALKTAHLELDSTV